MGSTNERYTIQNERSTARRAPDRKKKAMRVARRAYVLYVVCFYVVVVYVVVIVIIILVQFDVRQTDKLGNGGRER